MTTRSRLYSSVVCVSLLFVMLCYLQNDQFLVTKRNTLRNLVGRRLGSRSLYMDPLTLQFKKRIVEVNNPVKDETKLKQILNFRQGKGMILSVHITHHAGTSLCSAMSEVLPVPSFACMSEEGKMPQEAHRKPWATKATTSQMIKVLQPLFRFISWEFGEWGGNLHQTDWENERLVSIIVMRDPLERFLAGGKCGVYHETLRFDPTPETQPQYWEYANCDCALNFAMRVLTEKKYGSSENRLGASLSEGEKQLEEAKNLMKRFTFIVDQTCLTDSVPVVGRELNLKLDTQRLENLHGKHASLRERFGNDTLYEYVKHRFRYDIELYEWAKTQSIVQCNNMTVTTSMVA